jgi:LL-diaminopimelate aminotransferase
MFAFADRIQALPPYLFAAIDALKQEALSRGMDLIDLGVGDPDLPTPLHIQEALSRAVKNPEYHRYPSYIGGIAFREAAARFMQRRFGVEVSAKTETIALIGSKEGIGHFPVAFVNPGDVVLTPDPAYPVYASWTLFCGGETHLLPLTRERNFLPDLGSIPQEVLSRAKILWLNYPNNPTGAACPFSFLEEAVAFGQKHKIIIAHDLAYSEVYFNASEAPRSILEVPGAKEVAIEFHSLSKAYNMTGWRVGFACGNAQLVAGLGKVKTNVDSGVFGAVQEAAIVALESPTEIGDAMRARYKTRRDILVPALRAAGFTLDTPTSSFYLWAGIKPGHKSADITAKLLSELGIVTTPGNGFGAAGEGFVRFTLCASEERLQEAARRLAGFAW